MADRPPIPLKARTADPTAGITARAAHLTLMADLWYIITLDTCGAITSESHAQARLRLRDRGVAGDERLERYIQQVARRKRAPETFRKGAEYNPYVTELAKIAFGKLP